MTVLRWLRTIVLAGIGFLFLVAYSGLYQTIFIRTPVELFRSSLAPLAILLVEGLPFLAGLMLGLAAFNGPIRGLRFSVLNLLAIAFLPILFGCGLPTLAAAGRLMGPLGRSMSGLFLFRSPMFSILQPLAAFIAGAGIGVSFTRGSKPLESEAVSEEIASSSTAAE